MEVDRGDPQSSNEALSPLPMKMARRLRQEPRILFVFDDATGDFTESYPTIFLLRPAATPAPSQGLHHSVHSHPSPVNPDSVYLNAAQGSKSDPKKKKKDQKGKDKVTRSAIPLKHMR